MSGTEVRSAAADGAERLRRRLLVERRDEVRELHRLRPLHNLKIPALAGSWAVGLYLSVGLVSPLWAIPGALLTTSGLLGMAILMHDGAHHLLARSSTWNRWLGFFCGAPALISATAYRFNHTTHHAVTGTDADPGDLTSGARRANLPVGWFVILVLLFGTPLFLPTIARGGYRRANARGRRQILVEYALIGAAALLAVSLVPFPVLLYGWIVPFVLGGLANNVRSLAEHSFTDRDDPLRNARTMHASWWVDLVQSNVNYHWEHHVFPGVPWYNLPALHRLLAEERRTIRPPTAGGYLSWLWHDVLGEIAPSLRSR